MQAFLRRIIPQLSLLVFLTVISIGSAVAQSDTNSFESNEDVNDSFDESFEAEPSPTDTNEPLESESQDFFGESSGESESTNKGEEVEESTEESIEDATEEVMEPAAETETTEEESTEAGEESTVPEETNNEEPMVVVEKKEPAPKPAAIEEIQEDTVKEKQWHIRPKIGVGVGMMNYQGDLVASRGYFNPFQNRTAVQVFASQALNDEFDLTFFMLYGSLGADERTLVRNLNFRSRITAGGLGVSYNFSNFFKPTNKLTPFVSLGFEVFEFQSKTDLTDSYGNEYQYWSDGTIRNIAEDDAEAGEAIEITRDYVYETDIRKKNLDGFGDYSERSFAIPAGVGFNLDLNEKMDFTMGLEYHWTFTDYIDGVTEQSRGIRQGNKQSDKFLLTFARLSYDLTPIPHEDAPDFSGGDNADADLDSIPDFLDNCPNTPIGIEVDSKGCPLDSDNDGVPDFADSEINSPEGSIVDSSGVALTDADFEQFYLEWTDETGEYSQYTNTSYSVETAERKTKRKKKQYTVKVGEFENGVDDSLANVLLGMPEVTTRVTEDGTTVIEMAGFDNLPEALAKKIQLESEGIATGDISETSSSGETSRVSTVETDMIASETLGMTVDEVIAKNKTLPRPKRLILNPSDYTLDRPIDPRSVSRADDSEFGNQTVYRVQVGAYANMLSRDVFEEIPDLIVITTSDGLTRYYVGAVTSYEQAASRKIDMVQAGFDGAHVIPFKNGQRALINSSGNVEMPNSQPREMAENFGKVKFKIQIGLYTGQIPTDDLNKMMDIGRIDQRDAEDGAVRYLTGEFNNFEDAEVYKDELASKGFADATIVAEHENKIISATEGIQLLNK